ncbi:MAG: entF [Myxococcales bacterium]|nr:entF [Myxococcales bacterium]
MRILQAANFPYFRTGGGFVTTRTLLRQLAKAGHACIYVGTTRSWTVSGAEADTEAESLQQLRDNGVTVDLTRYPIMFRDQGVEVHLLRTEEDMARHLEATAKTFLPDWGVLGLHGFPSTVNVMTSALPLRQIIICCLATIGAPFGPDRIDDGSMLAKVLPTVGGTFAPSHYVRRYFEEWGGVSPRVLYLPLYGPGPFRKCNDPDGYVLMINPSPIKGVSVFTGLAEAMPDVRFAAVRSWDTRPEVVARLSALPNVTLLEGRPHERMDEIYSRARILLAPSIVHEAFGLVVVEAMLRGVPVLGASHAGIPESKLGVPYLLPLTPLEPYAGPGKPREIPPQDLAPWQATIERLVADPVHYAELSVQSYERANEFVAELPETMFADYLASLA